MRVAFKKAIAGLLTAGVVLLITVSAGAPWMQAAAAKAPPPAKPRPAEIMPRAAQELMLDIVNTGEHLIAVGERGHILASNDGQHWAQVTVPVRSTLTAVCFIDARHGWAVGHDAAILMTADGGRTWSLQNFEPEKEMAFLDVLFVDSQRGYAVGAFGLFYATNNGGASWGEVEAKPVREEELYFHGLARLNDGSLFIAGETGMLGVSADGVDWTRLKSPYEGTFFGVLPHGAKGALVFGLRGNVYVSDDVRSNVWTRLPLDTLASFYGGALLPDGRAVLAGSSGALLVIDGAGHASPLASGESSSLAAVLPVKGGVVLAGENGLKRLDKSLDQGL